MPKNKFLHYRHTGKLVSLFITAIYSCASYYFMGYMKELLSKGDFNITLIIIFITFFVGALNVLRDIAVDEFDMQSPANKERQLHDETKDGLVKTQRELDNANNIIQEKKSIIHAMQCQINNSFIDSKDDTEAIEKVKRIMSKVNANKNVNNSATTINYDSDYMSAFGV